MVLTGYTALKMRYLGDGYVGQDLCRCEIDVCLNVITVTRYRGHSLVWSKVIEDPSEVARYKSLLRAFYYRLTGVSGWKMVNIYGGKKFVKYYPSASWEGRTGVVRWMLDDGSF